MSTVFYKSKDGQNHPIKFYDLLDEGWNMDKFIREGTVFSRPDHNYSPLLKYLNPGDVVYDCGAYIGTFAIPFAIEGMKVHAFEAWPGNSERCRKNFVPYDITLHEVALSDRNEQKNAQIIHCMGWEYYDPQEYRLIEYVRLDDYISKNSLPNPSLIKMDIEGMESLAMLGATNLLEKVRPVWQMGLHLQIKHGVDLPTFPGWVDSIDGGFNWSKINQLDYIVCDYNGNQINPNIILLQGGEYIFVPKEKW